MSTRTERESFILREPRTESGIDTQHLQNGEHEEGGRGGGSLHRQSSFSPELVQKKGGQGKNGHVHVALPKGATNYISKSAYKPVKKYSENDFDRTNTILDSEKNKLQREGNDLPKLWASLSICWGSNAQVRALFKTLWSHDFHFQDVQQRKVSLRRDSLLCCNSLEKPVTSRGMAYVLLNLA